MSTGAGADPTAAEAWRRTVQEVLDAELGTGWLEQGGPLPEDDAELVLTPGRADTTDKRVPLQSVYAKVVAVRDRLRLLEQNINSHDRLSGRDKLAFQARITAVHQALLALAASIDA